MPSINPMNTTNVLFDAANAVSIYENSCVAVEVPTVDSSRIVYIRASCAVRIRTAVESSTTPEILDNNTESTSMGTLEATTVQVETTPDVSGADAAGGGSDDVEPLTLAFSGAAIFIWILLIVLALRYRSQRQKLRRAKMMVIAHQGDIAFGTPEPMTKGTEDGFTGGEIDPVTGQVTMFKQGAELEADGSMMPGMWGGQRQNPMHMFGIDQQPAAATDSDEDSLGNLSEFEDADFEAFADSLLDDTVEDELFGYNRAVGGASEFGRGLPDMEDDNDSLSDFENDNPVGYLGIETDIEDFDQLPGPSDAIFGHQRDSMVGLSLASPVQSASLAQNTAGRQLNRDSILSAGSVASIGSFDSLSDDEDLVVAQPTYEAVGQTWTRRGGAP